MASNVTRSVEQSIREEFANALTHGLGVVLSIIGLFVLIWAASAHEDVTIMAASVVYGLSLVVLYAASTLYHSFRLPNLKRVFKIVDHCAIFILIAGSYTPVTLITLQGGWGWALFLAAWTIAAVGVVFKIFCINRFPKLGVALYLLMGWMVIVAFGPLIRAMPATGVWLIVAGGLFYSIGVLFYGWHRLPFNHSIWHLFVLAGSIAHFLAILFYVIL